MAAAAVTSMNHEPVVKPIPGLLTRLSIGTQSWLFKGLVATVLPLARFIKAADAQKVGATYTKRYDIKPASECRVFIPSSYKPGEKLPLFIDIHGGGFAIGDPQLDDRKNHHFCNTFGYIVVSLQYRLAPVYPFPTGVDDCTELALAVLEDNDLPIDLNRVALGGQSAGGNLALAIAQDSRLQGKIKALVPIYPVVDFTDRFSGDFRDRPEGAGGFKAKKDGLRSMSHLFSWCYIPYGKDRTDPRLSVIFADPSKLPKSIYFVAAQYDKLCQEAYIMAKKLAGDESLQEDQDWEKNGIRWERVPHAMHGFAEQDFQGVLAREDDSENKRIAEVFKRIATWLDGVFAGNV